MNDLLIEIGTEEIPASYIEPALDALAARITNDLDKARIGHGQARIFGTPRRLAVIIDQVAEKQESVTVEMIGPPERVGFDESGNPAVPAIKFAEKVGIDVSQIRIKETEKGRYLCAEKTEPAKDTVDILKDLLPKAIQAMPFPKTMKWADLKVFFARPIQWIVALLGEQVIEFPLAQVRAGRTTHGHRFEYPEPIEIANPAQYVETLRNAGVIVDFQERRDAIVQGVAETAGSAGGNVLPDEELVDTVKNLVEKSEPILGRFEEEFLEVPDEVLITAMREHQKYFAVVDDTGKLMPCFVAVNNTRAKDMDLVANGHGRVIRARLADAKFFYKADLEISGDERMKKLEGVLFQAELGTMLEKTQRVRELAGYLSDVMDRGPELKAWVQRAAELCKSDLVSNVVVEFPKLQGVMGRIYAEKAQEPGDVAQAIEEHYRPTYSGGPLPKTETGAILAIADKIDSICGCFRVGLIPTGASDPYALRRQGIGILSIMLDKEFPFSLKALIEKSTSLFGDKGTVPESETVDQVYTFLRNRMAHMLTEEGFSKDVVAAVVDVSIDHVPNVRNRVKALETLKSQPDFEPLAIGFKRVVNIIRKSAGDIALEDTTVDTGLFEHDSERELYSAYQDVKQKVSENLARNNFDQALLDIASMRPTVDAFFDGVLVMAQNPDIRDNRLKLLNQVAGLFQDFADFSKITTTQK